MIEAIRIFGVYMPAALFWAAVAPIVTLLSGTVKQGHVLRATVPSRYKTPLAQSNANLQSQRASVDEVVNLSLTWVLLAQRIPVRIAIDSIPPAACLVPGRDVAVRRSLPW